MQNNNFKPLKPTKSNNGLLIIFQFRIYAGILLNIMSLIGYEVNLIGITIATLLFSPIIVSLVLFYKKLIAFRVWYMIGAFINIVFAIVGGGTPIVGIIVEILVIVWIFKSRYIGDNFKKIGEKG